MDCAGKRFKLSLKPTIRRQEILCIEPCDDMIDTRTAATHALFYACWAGDIELATNLIHDLYELIDINTLIKDYGITDLIIMVPRSDYNKNPSTHSDYADKSINICRLLIICYGSKIHVYHRSRRLMDFCLRRNYADVVLYLATLYDDKIYHPAVANDIFKCLAINDQEEGAIQYLSRHRIHIRRRLVILPITREGSASMFRYVLTAFESSIDADDDECLFKALCTCLTVQDWDNKVRIVSELLVNQLTAEIITKGLVDNMALITTGAHSPDRARLGRMASVVMRIFIDLIQDRGIEVALALCCMLGDLELLNTLIDRNIEQICADPKLARHAIIECVNYRDIDTFEHILTRVGVCVCADALEYWSRAGDLEAVRVVLEVSMADEPTINRLPLALRLACQEGDVELVEIIIEFANDWISKSGYRLAFHSACMFGREQVIRLLAARCRHYLNFCTDEDILSYMNIKYFNSDLALLINSLFGTSLDPASCAMGQFLKATGNQGKAVVGYDSIALTYDLRKDSR